MSLPDILASAALGGEIVKPVYLAYLDILGDPVRVCTAGYDITPSGTGDPDLDGVTFEGIQGDFIDISPVRIGQGGSQSVTAELSGIQGVDIAMINAVEDSANWQLRSARLWRIIRNAENVQQGAIQHYYTGYMVQLSHSGSTASQTLSMTIEGYLAAFSAASNRTYLVQSDYDAGDLSARAGVAIANGVSSDPLTNNTGTTRPNFGGFRGRE